MLFLAEARPFLPIDLPLVRRLAPYGVSLDSATSLTRGVDMLEGAVWGSVPLADLGRPTFVLRDGERSYVAQFRHKVGDEHAHIAFIAPSLECDRDSSAWLNLLDTMVVAAGKRGALTLNAEVDGNSEAFVVLREAGFAVYARQTIWLRAPGAVELGEAKFLREATEADSWAIHSLYANLVPRLVSQGDGLPESGSGLIYERHGQALAYLAIHEGKSGIYIQPYFRPDIADRATQLIAEVWDFIPRADRVPVYVCVRQYQEYLHHALNVLDFEPWASQAVMVKHTSCRVEHPAFEPAMVRERLFALPPVADYYTAYQTDEGRKGVRVSKN